MRLANYWRDAFCHLDNSTMPTTFEIVSISTLAERLRTSQGRVRDVAAAMGIKPAGRIDGEDHFDEADAERIRKHLQTIHRRKAASK
jgi:hypothetical protein